MPGDNNDDDDNDNDIQKKKTCRGQKERKSKKNRKKNSRRTIGDLFLLFFTVDPSQPASNPERYLHLRLKCAGSHV